MKDHYSVPRTALLRVLVALTCLGSCMCVCRNKLDSNIVDVEMLGSALAVKIGMYTK